jgi:hypothetical protein
MMKKKNYIAPHMVAVEMDVVEVFMNNMSMTETEITDENAILSTGSDEATDMSWKSNLWDEE